MAARSLRVALVPSLVSASDLAPCIAVAIDVLRATTSIVQALAAGCTRVYVCAEIDEAQALRGRLGAAQSLLAGERGGKPLPGFDLGNSPREFTAERCRGRSLVMTTSNGTRALVHAAHAERVLAAAFANVSAVCEQLRADPRPITIVCAGDDGRPCLEDALLAGAIVEQLAVAGCALDDSADLAHDSFLRRGANLLDSLKFSQGGRHLATLGYAADLPVAASVDLHRLVPELRREPLRLEAVHA